MLRTLPHPAAVAARETGRPGLASATPIAKRFATAQAHAMWFYGIRLDLIDGDDGAPLYVATLHALTRNFRSIAEVEGWIAALDALDAPRHEVARFIGALEPVA